MRKEHFRRLLTLLLATTASALGCSDSYSGQDSGTEANSAGGSSTATAANTSSTTVSTSTSGAQGTTGASTTGSVVSVDCSAAQAPCGGDVVGTWNVAASCLELSGDMDVFLTSLACATVPATGELQTSGTFIANADGTYTDNTTTTGTVSFPLDSSCLSISGVDVECERVGPIFTALGWTTSACSADATGQCSCTLSTEQQGGLGLILPYTEPNGAYTTADNTLTATNATYGYCVSGDTLTLEPEMDALTGSVVLQREGTAASTTSSTGSGGMSGVGGTSSVGGMTSVGGMSGAGGAAGASNTTEGAGGSGGNPATGVGPCDIYEAAGHTCVAAHSTVRALFGSFDGNLYQVKRADGTTQDVPVLSAGGFADSSVQDSFCSGSTCTITVLYDQSGHGNFLEAQTPDSSVGGYQGQTAANAAAEQLSVGGHQVYSLFTRPSQAYWNDGSQNGMPLGAEPQGIYMVTSGEHYNGGCCYNYGNAQLDRNYHGGPTMDAVYFGNNTIWGTGAGNGPWVMADMEDGMLAWGNGGNNPNSPSLPFPYVTAMEKNDGTSTFALKGGDATQPTLTTMWDGNLPGSKIPMEKEGAVILGAGGDCCYSNNNASEGTFYEGAIVAGYPSDETDQAVHANVVEVGYGQ